MFRWFDYLIVILPLIGVYSLGLYVRRYIRSVSDFVSAGRMCGRYLITVGDVANALAIITLLSYVEVHYKTGFALTFWNGIISPISIFLGLAGYCTYRFRETKAMSIGQFIEMRYSRKLRIFAAALRSISEMLANMIMPALAARFFIYFMDIPKSFNLFGVEISSFLLIMILSMVMAISIILMGGMLSIIVTDSLQGLLLYPLLIAFVIFIVCKFSWNHQIAEVMMDRAPGESFINPLDIHKLRDFNYLMFSVSIISLFLHRASWFASGATVAKNAHEQKMAGLLGGWRGALVSIFYILVTIGVITTLNHVDFAPQAKVIRNNIVSTVAKDVIKDEAVRNRIIENAAAIPQHDHRFGGSRPEDAPLGDKHNLDTPYLNSAREILAKEEGGMAQYAKFRALYNQVMPTITLRHILPPGMLGLFVLLMVMAMVSTDDSRIYSAAATISQDVILPLRKNPFTPKQHMMVIRIVAICIGVFFIFGSYFMSQLDYISLFVTIMTTMWLGGCGPVLIFGLYSRFGTTAGAWTSLITGMVMALTGTLLSRNWADYVYPFLERHDLVESVGNFLAAVSRPLNPIVIWEMKPEKFPINSYEIKIITMATTLILYILVSKLTLKEPFNLERMLHRGIYSDGTKKPTKQVWTFKAVLSKMVGITSEYTRGDKIIAWSSFVYSFIYGFLGLFVVVVIWNLASPWKPRWWTNYYGFRLLLVPAIVACISTVWFGLGGIRDMIRLCRDLKNRDINNLDDGRVEGNVSLADKAAFEAAEAAKAAEVAKASETSKDNSNELSEKPAEKPISSSDTESKG